MQDIDEAIGGRNSNYNLLEEPWIKIIYLDGRDGVVSLRDVLINAHIIKKFNNDMPNQDLPLLRLLEAVLYRAYGMYFASRLGERRASELRKLWKKEWQTGHFNPQIIRAYFDRFHKRFNLFDSEYPFYQTPGLAYPSKDAEFDSVGELEGDVPKADKFVFSMRSRNNLDKLPSADAARWLLFFQAYDIGGIKSQVLGETHIKKGRVYAPKARVQTGWLGALGCVYLEQDSLFRTLMLNWCLFNPYGKTEKDIWFGNPNDLPAWEREPAGPDLNNHYHLTGIVDLYTLQSRRVRLIPDQSGQNVIGVISCYGDVIQAHNMDSLEPMSAWRYGTEQQRKELQLPTVPRVPVTFTADKAIWRQLQPLVSAGNNGAGESEDTRPGVIKWLEDLLINGCLEDEASGSVLKLARIHTQAMIYEKRYHSKYVDSVDDSLDASVQLFRLDSAAVDVIVTAVEQAEKSVNALARLAGSLEESSGNQANEDSVTKSQQDRYKIAYEAVKERAYESLDSLFRERISDYTPVEDIEDYRQEWYDAIHRKLFDIGQECRENASAPSFAVRYKRKSQKTTKDGRKVQGSQDLSAAVLFFHFEKTLNDYLGYLPRGMHSISEETEVR